MGEWSAGCPSESSIYNAYIHLIKTSKHYIYLEVKRTKCCRASVCCVNVANNLYAISPATPSALYRMVRFKTKLYAKMKAAVSKTCDCQPTFLEQKDFIVQINPVRFLSQKECSRYLGVPIGWVYNIDEISTTAPLRPSITFSLPERSFSPFSPISCVTATTKTIPQFVTKNCSWHICSLSKYAS